eukprot:m.441452 g.441452  ORF g.441452 m.441452 type:complete len:62 (+) comp20282_c2_seq16:818-1003(+)
MLLHRLQGNGRFRGLRTVYAGMPKQRRFWSFQIVSDPLSTSYDNKKLYATQVAHKRNIPGS